MNKVENLTNFEKDLLIQWFLYQMEFEQRVDLMENFPKVYFKLTGVKAKVWNEKGDSV